MNLKTFTARSMGEALAEVRRQIGADAVILHTRTYQRGGLLGIGSRQVVEVTAVSGREYAQRRNGASRGRSPTRGASTSSPTSSRRYDQVDRTGVTDETRGDQQGAAGDLIRRTYAAARAELEHSTPSSTAQAESPPAPTAAASSSDAPASAPSSSSVATASSRVESDHLADEMRSMKRMVARMMGQQQRQHAQTEMPEKLFDQYLALLEQEVTEELAGEIVQQVRQQLSVAELEDEEACRHAVMQAVAGLLPIGETAGAHAQSATAIASGERSAVPTAERASDDRPRTVALVGPTGVGKTTTIAKLAATFKLKQNKHVGLITMDTYRIAAVDQLKTYAGIIGVPLHVVSAPDQMAEAVAQCRGCDVVLIDTAGRSQRDDPRLEELRSYLEAAAPHETHLVLSSTCTQRVLEDTIERFSKIRTDRIIFTKLDEAVTLGVVLNVLRKVEKRLSYVTTGQEVPHQIEPGRPDRLAALLLGESAVSQ